MCIKFVIISPKTFQRNNIYRAFPINVCTYLVGEIKSWQATDKDFLLTELGEKFGPVADVSPLSARFLQLCRSVLLQCPPCC